jgi:hypothetical protein
VVLTASNVTLRRIAIASPSTSVFLLRRERLMHSLLDSFPRDKSFRVDDVQTPKASE